MNKTIEKFELEFNTEFKNVFEPLQKIGTTKIIQSKDTVQKLKYSDWDIEGTFKPKAITKRNLLKIDMFLRTFKGFTNVGLFLAMGNAYRGKILQAIDDIQIVQYMAYMPDEPFAPFFDINLIGQIPNEIIRTIANQTDDEFLRWATITAWRKIKNRRYPKAISVYRTYLAPMFPADEEKFVSDPYAFYALHFPDKKYDSVVTFLHRN